MARVRTVLDLGTAAPAIMNAMAVQRRTTAEIMVPDSRQSISFAIGEFAGPGSVLTGQRVMVEEHGYDKSDGKQGGLHGIDLSVIEGYSQQPVRALATVG